MFRSGIILFLALLILSCSDQEQEEQLFKEKFKTLPEKDITEIKIEGAASLADAELSGLAWLHDKLVLLPQYPYYYGDGSTGSVFYISRSDIINYIKHDNTQPLTPKKISFIAEGFEEFNSLGSGYEAIAFNGDTVYVAIESFQGVTKGFLARGMFDDESNSITLNKTTLVENDFKNRLPNLSEETLTIFNNKIITIHESNGINIFPNPYAVEYNSDLTSSTKIPFLNIEYRITDATSTAADGTFWVINYLWEGDTNLANFGADSLFVRYGIGYSHIKNPNVERLVKMKFTGSSIIEAPSPPIYINLNDENGSRNWEGLVKLDEMGFLLVTDKHPRTILAFLPSN